MSGFITDHIKQCIICTAPVDTREKDEGGGPDGCEVDTAQWVCSFDCWAEYVSTDTIRALKAQS